MKKLLLAMLFVPVVVQAEIYEARVLNVKPIYGVREVNIPMEVCEPVQVERQSTNTAGTVLGAIAGAAIGNQFGKGSGKEAATGVGALTGAIIGGNKDKGPQGYRIEQQCTKETRYKETEREVYSHSIVTFWHEGQRIELKFHK